MRYLALRLCAALLYGCSATASPSLSQLQLQSYQEARAARDRAEARHFAPGEKWMKGVLETQKCSQTAPASCNERHQVSMARVLSLRRVPVAEVHRVLRWYRARYQGFNSVSASAGSLPALVTDLSPPAKRVGPSHHNTGAAGISSSAVTAPAVRLAMRS